MSFGVSSSSSLADFLPLFLALLTASLSQNSSPTFFPRDQHKSHTEGRSISFQKPARLATSLLPSHSPSSPSIVLPCSHLLPRKQPPVRQHFHLLSCSALTLPCRLRPPPSSSTSSGKGVIRDDGEVGERERLWKGEASQRIRGEVCSRRGIGAEVGCRFWMEEGEKVRRGRATWGREAGSEVSQPWSSSKTNKKKDSLGGDRWRVGGRVGESFRTRRGREGEEED